MRLLSRLEVGQKIGIRSPGPLQYVIESPDFPKPVLLPGIKANKWRETDIEDWMKTLPPKETKGKVS